MTSVIAEFFGDYRFLSNFYPAPFVWSGIRWRTAEHAYQAAKATGSEKNDWIDKIIKCKTPGEAKRAGKKVPLRPMWDKIKDEIMLRIVTQKFVQNPTLLRRLIATGTAALEEGNAWGDNYWGKSPIGNSDGRNQLGKILMEIREQYKDFKELPKLAESNTFDQLEEMEPPKDES